MNGDAPPLHDLLRSFPDAVARRDPAAPPARTVYCVPSAGTGARTFLAAFAQSALRANLRVVQLPGREDRFAEPCMDDIREMAALVADAVVADRHGADYALFGHSFGGLVMLETARRLERIGAPPPAVLAIAACAPPHLPAFARYDELEPAEIVEALQELGGLDFSGRRGELLKPLVLPALAADARACTRYLDDADGDRIACPILAMSGSHDPALTSEEAAGWREYTAAAFETREYPGGHFFPQESALPLSAVVHWKHRLPADDGRVA